MHVCSVEMQLQTELLVSALRFERLRNQLLDDGLYRLATTALSKLPHVSTIVRLLDSVCPASIDSSATPSSILCTMVKKYNFHPSYS